MIAIFLIATTLRAATGVPAARPSPAAPGPKRVINTDFTVDAPDKPADPNASVLNVKAPPRPTYRPVDDYDEVRMITKPKTRSPAKVEVEVDLSGETASEP